MSQLAISNIAWTAEEEPAIAELLQELGVTNVEIAPTKVWDDPLTITDQQIKEYIAFWAGYGIRVVAFQSMLFTKPDLRIFKDETSAREAQELLKGYIALAGKMNVSALVFGSPKNRQKGELAIEEANVIATNLFTKLGDSAQTHNTIFCIEPNPTDYACDFVTNAEQGYELVRRVDSPGFKLHLDIAGMTLAGDDIAESIANSISELQHFHISSPSLGQVEDNDVQHRVASDALRDAGYKGYVSIEMRPGDAGTNVERVRTAVTFAQDAYSSYLG